MGDFGGLARPSKRRKVVGAVGDNTRGGGEETSMNGHATITNDMASVTRREKGVRFEVEGLNGLNGHAAENGAEGEDGRSDQGGGDEEGEPHRDNKHEPEPSPKSSGRSLRSSTRLRKPPTRYAEVEPVEKPKRSLRTRRKVGEVLGQAQGEGEVESVVSLSRPKRQGRMANGARAGAGVGTGSRPDPNVHAGRISREGNGRPAVQNRESNGDEVWEVPSDDDDDDDDDGDQLQDGVTDGLELDPAVEQGDDGEEAVEGEDEVEADHDMSALQLQQELVDNDTPVAEPEELPPYAYEFKKLCEESELEGHVGSLATFILKKLTGKHPIPLRCLDSQYQTVHQLVEQTVVAGEGNSLLLLGSRGCGKTAVVEAVISSLANNHRDDFHVVRLNGFLHTDDRIALREIWRQLGREMNTEDETSKTISYADTMASLLGLLSHPEELFGVSEDPNAIATAKSVIIILDEFDLFAYHPRQTLLYNLFDIAQARKAPLAVLGLTTKVDVTENLEKRVKSRFSHRYVFLPRPRSFSEFSEICKAGIALSEEELPMVGLDDLKNRGGKLLLDGWNEYIQNLWADSAFETHLQRIYHQTKSPKDFFTSALLPISTLYHSIQQPSNTNARNLQPPTPKSFSSHPLSCLDPAPLPFPPATSSTSNTSLPLSLLLAATRLTALHDPGLNATQPQAPTPLTLSFPAAYAEYVRLLTSAKTSASAAGAAATPGRVWGKDVAREAWERLVNWGLVVPVGGGSGMGDGRMFRIEISFEEVLDGVGDSGVGALGRWWREV
ncbi:origin recognition complex subunit 4 [Blastomyces gilchristii SLH14081]|uniref:Origin recognition complex subunit 4 n=1 Tax=Blastomyces gilchristii (strain SLH14081) TaxID=559298 RepID=A0A179UXT3_BLAGS|nr:origin recognition complex subunit 4 [Blastomyces gilchristii SLH14081]OAT11938.1 origin recognition complex subunit 4 [Blastomyces gilchristii SLH14081]